MCKKFAIVALAVAAGVFLLSYTRIGSHVRHAVSKVSERLETLVPMEAEIARIGGEIDQIDRDTKAQFKDLADEIVAVENLKTEVVTARANVGKMKDTVLALKEQVKTGTRTVSLDGREVTLEKAQAKLARDWEAYKLASESLKSREMLLEAKEDGLTQARAQLGIMRQKKDELKVTLARLEAQLKTLRVAEARNNFRFDDSRLGHIKESITKLQNRLRSAEVRGQLEDQFTKGGDFSAEKKSVKEDLLKEIESHFGQTGDVAREPQE